VHNNYTIFILLLHHYFNLTKISGPSITWLIKFFVATDHRKSVILKAFMSKPENDKLLALLYQFNIEKIEVVLITNQSGYLQIRHVTILILIHDWVFSYSHLSCFDIHLEDVFIKGLKKTFDDWWTFVSS
jgi:hypothetical protein